MSDDDKITNLNNSWAITDCIHCNHEFVSTHPALIPPAECPNCGKHPSKNIQYLKPSQSEDND